MLHCEIIHCATKVNNAPAIDKEKTSYTSLRHQTHSVPNSNNTSQRSQAGFATSIALKENMFSKWITKEIIWQPNVETCKIVFIG